MHRLVLALLAIAVLAPPAAGSGSSPHAPAGVMAAEAASAVALLEWLPGQEPADSYRVYGVAGASLSLLLDTAESPAPLLLAAAVPAGYPAYAVSGVRNGMESHLVLAGGPGIGCIRIQTDPPDIGSDGCKVHAARKVRTLP